MGLTNNQKIELAAIFAHEMFKESKNLGYTGIEYTKSQNSGGISAASTTAGTALGGGASYAQRAQGKPTYAGVKKKKGKMTKSTKMIIFFTILFALAFIGGLYLVLNVGQIGNIYLIALGVVGLLSSVILYKIADWRSKNICSECGANTEHHRHWLRTQEKLGTLNGRTNNTYTHYYLDTYDCPNCGHHAEYQISKSGGTYSISSNGTPMDRRTAPKEF